MRLGCGSYQWVLIAALLMNGVVGTNDTGKKFLEANKAKEGVIVLPSGLQYKVRTLRATATNHIKSCIRSCVAGKAAFIQPQIRHALAITRAH